MAAGPATPAGEVELGEVRVSGSTDVEPAPFALTQSSSTVGPQELGRKQPDNIFEAVRDVPGVSINGGPRASGMTFNIRGYGDTEDVRIKLDGVTKQFEKYRFGGTFIDPEMLKSIEVQRGPQIASGSGALGGTVLATTKDAADLLRPGQRFGVQAKAGYATSNYETLGAVTAYGRPTEASDVMVSVLKRDSKDYKLPDGEVYRYSETNTDSALLKGTLFAREDLSLSGSYVDFNDSGPQPYDATGGQPGVGGTVFRSVKDRTTSTTLKYEPGEGWVDLRATMGYAQTHVHDFLTPGLSTLATPFPPPSGSGGLNDDYDYEIWTVDAANTSRIGKIGEIGSLSVLLGVQFENNERTVTRRAENPAANAADGPYPGGFNPAQPSGTKRTYAAYVQPRIGIGPLELVPGVRWDLYQLEAAGQTVEQLDLYRQASTVSYTEITSSFGASFQLVPQRLTLFYNYAQGFRPPLIDEVFSQYRITSSTAFVFSRCNPVTLKTLAPPSGICGDLYRPEQSTTREAGVSFSHPGFWGDGGLLAAKATYFSSYTDQLLESLMLVSPGVVGQPGWEKRHGVEIEAAVDTGAIFGHASYSSIRGTTYTCPGVWCLPPPFPNGGPALYGLFGVPGDTASLTLGARFFARRLEIAYSFFDVSGRDVIKAGLTLQSPGPITHQDGYLLQSASIRFTLTSNLELRVTGENLTNERYLLNAGEYQGAEAPGRNVRFTISARY